MLQATTKPLPSLDQMHTDFQNYKNFVLVSKEKMGDERAAIYFENRLTLMYDNIRDIWQKKDMTYTYEVGKGALIKLVDGQLPYQDELMFKAMVKVAYDCGLHLAYEVTIIDGEGIVEFAASEIGTVHIPSRWLKTTKVQELEEIEAEDIKPLEDGEVTVIAFNKTFFTPRFPVGA